MAAATGCAGGKVSAATSATGASASATTLAASTSSVAQSTGVTLTAVVAPTFFDQTTINTISTTVSPYSSEGVNPTTNTSDRVYSQQEDGTTLLTLTGSITAGFAATVNAYLPI